MLFSKTSESELPPPEGGHLVSIDLCIVTKPLYMDSRTAWGLSVVYRQRLHMHVTGNFSLAIHLPVQLLLNFELNFPEEPG
jgi:hypothetical protein